MLLGIPRSARCVQRFDDSLNSAIHITYRISLRSSSSPEPRDPPLRGVDIDFHAGASTTHFDFSHLEFGRERNSQGRLATEREDVAIFLEPAMGPGIASDSKGVGCVSGFLDCFVSMILPQVHLRKPCYDFSFL